MRALLWKDYRMNRALLIVCGAMLVAPYFIGAAYQYYDEMYDGMAVGKRGGAAAASALAAMAVSLLTISLLAASAFTQERTDRSAEFLAHLPPSKWNILLSKFALAFGVACVLWTVNAAMGLIVAPKLGQFQPSLHEAATDLLCTSVLVFGAGWAASTWMTSPVGAWGIAAAAPMVVGGVMFASWYFFGTPAESEFQSAYRVLVLLCGMAAIAISSGLYLRREEP